MLENEGKEQKVGAYWNYYDQSRCIFLLCPWSLLEQELPTSAAANASLFPGENAKSAGFYSIFYRLTILEFLDFYAHYPI